MFELSARDLGLSIDESGRIASVMIRGCQALKSPSPLMTLLSGGRALAPTALERAGNRLTLTMEDGSHVVLETGEHPLCVTLRVLEAPRDAYAAVFGPIFAAPDEVIGDVIGVVQGGELAFGMMSLCPKTLEGTPRAYAAQMNALCDYLPTETNISTSGMEPHERAATALNGGGSVLHMFCRDRTREEYGEVMGAPEAWIQPMPEADPDAHIAGAGVLLFGCARAQALERIGQLEIEQGLPHPMIDGEWVKTARSAMQSYMITEFTRDDLDMVLDKAELAGFRTIYHPEPFRNWGHFEWREDLAHSDADFKAAVTDRAAARGIKVGLHTLTNFTTTNDPYVTPAPSEHLLKLARVRLLRPVAPGDGEICVTPHVCFGVAQTLNALQIGDELLTFAAAQEAEGELRLTGVERGAFGTRAAGHAEGEDVYLLRDYPYRTLFPDLALQDSFSDRIAELFNATGAAQISYDGLEGCSYTGHDLYAPTRFMTRCHAGYDHFVLNDGSGLHHYTWHISTRMNWGEPWGEAMRTGQVASRIRNQDFFRRNLFPRMLGWFLLRLNERRFECSSREDLEWALSEAAGFDAGYAITVKPAVLRRHGRIDQLLSLIRDWDRLRYADAFTEEQKARLRRPENEFRLEKQDEGRYTLYPISISRPYTCALSEMQPGQTGGSDWSIDNPQGASLAFRLRVEGDGEIRNPMFRTANGAIKFPCTVADGQYLLYDLDGTAQVTDKNYNTLATVQPVGSATLPHGVSALAFGCDHERDETPDVTVRFITRGSGEQISL